MNKSVDNLAQLTMLFSAGFIYAIISGDYFIRHFFYFVIFILMFLVSLAVYNLNKEVRKE